MKFSVLYGNFLFNYTPMLFILSISSEKCNSSSLCCTIPGNAATVSEHSHDIFTSSA